MNLEKCLRYLEMTLDPESEVLRCDDCPAYEKLIKVSPISKIEEFKNGV